MSGPSVNFNFDLMPSLILNKCSFLGKKSMSLIVVLISALVGSSLVSLFGPGSVQIEHDNEIPICLPYASLFLFDYVKMRTTIVMFCYLII